MSTQDAVRQATGDLPARDVEDAWSGWVDAARAAGEPSVAVALVERHPRRRPDLRGAAVAHARDLVLVGRAAEAVRVLGGATPPAGPGAGGLAAPEVVRAAAHAALGDDRAWSWLRETARDAPLVAAVADARGDRAAGDQAWLAAATTPAVGVLTARAVEASVAGRGRRARGLDGLVGRGAERLLHVGGTAAVRDVAERLAQRDDRAGARLLLRAAAVRTPDATSLHAALRAVTPGWIRLWPLAAVAAVVLAGVAWVAFAVTAGTPAPAVSKLTVVLAHVALPLVLQSVREPGFTAAETRVWRRLSEQTYDPELDGPGQVQGRRSGWYALAAMLGAGLGLVLGAGVVVPRVVERTGDATWQGSDDAFFLHLAAVVLGATLGAVLTRSVARRLVRRRHDRRAARARLLEEQLDATCRCYDERLLAGRAAAGYAAHHLAPVGFASPLPGTSVRRCPRTGAWWLTGPVGSWDGHLALRG
ncbi:hypothetical protein OMK64_03970 [Cellulomonas fimi]|uniref:hypothetical protein n=1 Tax=Cellulomonas fimi TaxID=1708 RepID=UPI00234C261D|nr:hypothetical protein [Cellulomonas fimi]MDC7120689.1 hypothetical protein [Cellulomonas fimi]